MKFPEHEKLKSLDGAYVTVGEFIDWLSEQDIFLCRWAEEEDVLVPQHGTRISTLIAKFFGINEAKLEAEKQQMLDEIRQMQGG